MNIEKEIPLKTYPYLATWVGPEYVHPNELIKTPISEIVLITKNEDGHIYIQYVDGNKPGWKTDKENEYQALPKGYKLVFTQ